MNRLLYTVLMFALIAAASDDFDINVYTAVRTENPIVVDGSLTDSAWEMAPLVGGFRLYGKEEKSQPQTFFRVLYSNEFLYFGIVCAEPQMDKHHPVAQARDAHAVFSTECIELFVDPEHSHDQYYQFAINSAGSIYDSEKQDPAWSAPLNAATAMGTEQWTMELAIPWQDLGVAPREGMLLGFNVCRDRHIGTKQWTNWSRVIAGFHDPARFAHLVLAGDATRIGELRNDLRKGERTGRIKVYSTEGFSETTYRVLAQNGLDALRQKLADIRDAMAAEKTGAAREELGKLISEYEQRTEPVQKALAGTEPLDAEQWENLDLQMSKLAEGLRNALWQARLRALLHSI